MIKTYFGTEQLDSPGAMFAALVIGMAFGFVLERAGFGSSRKLAGIFYFKDMTVLKVMFTAVITAMLGLSYALALGWISADQVYALADRLSSADPRRAALRRRLRDERMVSRHRGRRRRQRQAGCRRVPCRRRSRLHRIQRSCLASSRRSALCPVLTKARVLGEPSEPQVAFGMSRAVFALLFTLIAVGAFQFRGMGRATDGRRRQVSRQPIPQGHEPGLGRLRRRSVHSAQSFRLGCRRHAVRWRIECCVAAKASRPPRTISSRRNWPIG